MPSIAISENFIAEEIIDKKKKKEKKMKNTEAEETLTLETSPSSEKKKTKEKKSKKSKVSEEEKMTMNNDDSQVEKTKKKKRKAVEDVIRCYASGGRTIIFTETKDCASELAGVLFPGARALHGDILQQSTREVTLKGFRACKFLTLVATNVAARGLDDINDVQLIIQCEPPRDVEAYNIHRSGRTGRAGNTGVAVMLYDPRRSNISRIERDSGVKFEHISAGFEAAEALIKVSDSVIPAFRAAAEDLLSTSGLSPVDLLLLKALAKAAGYTEIKTRSLLSSMENYVTVKLEAGKPMYSPSFAFGVMRRFLPEEKVESVKGLTLTPDGSAVFDVPTEHLDAFMLVAKEAGNWQNFHDHIQEDLIKDRLVHSLTDYKRFGTVCVSWYNAHNPCPLPEAANDDRSRYRKKKKEKIMNIMIIYGGGDKKLAFLKPGGGGGKFLAINYCQGTVVVCDDTPQSMAARVLQLQSPEKEYGLVIKYYLQEINRPVTRSCFCAQLLANGQPAAAATKAENNKVVAVKKPKPEKTEIIIIKINPDTVDKEFKVHSVLTASGLTDKPKEDLVVDIDAADLHNQLAAVEYVEDMYTFYKLAESSSRVDDYMGKQPKNKLYNIKKRAYLVDWLIQVHNWFELMPETLYLTVYILDRFLSIETIKREGELQIVGIGAMLIASKYEEIDAPEVDKFVCRSDGAFTPLQVLAMEKMILGKLGWTLTLPTPYVFLVRFIKASAATSGVSDQTDEMENMVFYLAELSLMHYHSIITYCPSMLAASAVYAARCTLTKTPLWTETLKFYTGYSEPQIMDCAKLLVGCHIKAGLEENKLNGRLYRKYSEPERGSVALLSPARNLLLE